MAVPVIKSAAHIPGTSAMVAPPLTLDFLLSEATSYRSRQVIQIPQGGAGMWPGSFITAAGAPVNAAGGEATIAGITCYAYNPVDGAVNATCIVRDAEVIDAYLQYGTLDPVAVAAHLATLGIIVRPAVLRNVMPPSFAPDVPASGPPTSGIQAVVGQNSGDLQPLGEGAVEGGEEVTGESIRRGEDERRAEDQRRLDERRTGGQQPTDTPPRPTP
jgi:Bacteriophage lambda head decoration protein D